MWGCVLPLTLQAQVYPYWDKLEAYPLGGLSGPTELAGALYEVPKDTPKSFLELEEAVQRAERIPHIPSIPKAHYVMAFRFSPDPFSGHDAEGAPVVLTLPSPLMEEVLFICRDTLTGALWEDQFGKDHAIWKRTVFAPGWHLRMPALHAGERHCLLWTSVATPYRPLLTATPEKAFHIHNSVVWVWLASYFGLVSGLAIYNFFLFLFLRDKSYFWYVVTTLFLHIQFQMRLVGLDSAFFDPPSLWWIYHSGFHLVYIASCGLVLFGHHFLGDDSPKARRTLYILVTLSIFSSVISEIVPTSWSYKLCAIVGCVNLTTILLRALKRSWCYQDRLAMLYSAAWVFPTIGALLLASRELQILPPSFWTDFSLQIGNAVETLLLALGLGYRYRMHREEARLREMALQEKNLALQRAKAQSLESRVRDAARISDALNSPLMALLNLYDRLKIKMKNLHDQQHKASEDKAACAEKIIKWWESSEPLWEDSLSHLKDASKRMESLREDAAEGGVNLETTALLSPESMAPRSTPSKAP